MKEPTESQEQRALIQWASYTKNPINQKYKIIDHLIHIPNEGKRSLISGYNMKLMGLKSGVSDLFFAYPIHPYSGLWIELKTLKGKVSKLQYDFLYKMKEIGFKCLICRGWGVAKDEIINYLTEELKI